MRVISLALATLLAAACAACTQQNTATPAPTAAAAAATTAAADPVGTCAGQLERWATEKLGGTQSSGLTAEQTQAVATLVTNAIALRDASGTIPDGWLHAQAAAACAPLVAATTAGSG